MRYSLHKVSDKTIKVTCRGAVELPWAVLAHFQGDLKDLSRENYEKLKRSIIREGFTEPVSVWLHDGKHYILNGHQRLRTIRAMVESEGYSCPPLPCNLIEARDMKEAKRKVLALTAQYGEMTNEGLYKFAEESDLDPKELLGEFNFPEIDMETWYKSYYEPDALEPKEPEKKGKKPHECPNCHHVF